MHVNKKRHIGNDNVVIVWNDTEKEFNSEMLSGQLNAHIITVTPLTHALFRVQVTKQHDFDSVLPFRSTLVVPEAFLPAMLLESAINADVGAPQFMLTCRCYSNRNLASCTDRQSASNRSTASSRSIKVRRRSVDFSKSSKLCAEMASGLARPLHWVLKIGKFEQTIEFLTQLGMRVLRHEEFDAGCEATCNGPYSGRWSKTMIGYGSELTHFVFELTYNFGVEHYEHGNALRYVVLDRSKVHSASHEISFPDGYRVKFDDAARYSRYAPLGEDPVLQVCLSTASVAACEAYWAGVLGFRVVEASKDSIVLHSGIGHTTLRFEQVDTVHHAADFGRIAFAHPTIHTVYEAIRQSRDTIQNAPVVLHTQGKADVEVIILKDRDGHEICFVGEAGFNDLSKPQPGAEIINWKQRSAIHEAAKRWQNKQ